MLTNDPQVMTNSEKKSTFLIKLVAIIKIVKFLK